MTGWPRTTWRRTRGGVHRHAAPVPAGPRRSTVWTVQARMGAVRVPGRQLKSADGIEMVTLESTGLLADLVSVLEACRLAVQWSRGPGQDCGGETDKLDAMSLARLTEMGLLRAFRAAKAVRICGTTPGCAPGRAKAHPLLPALEKLLEGPLVKLSSVVSTLTTISAQDMIRAISPASATPARWPPWPRPDEGQARRPPPGPDGMFDDHHGGSPSGCWTGSPSWTGGLPSCLPGGQLTAAMPAAWGINADGTTGARGRCRAGLLRAERGGPAGGDLGISPDLARAIIAETGLDMTRFPPPPYWCPGPGYAPRPGSPGPAPGRQERPGRHLAAQLPRPGRHRRRPHRHLPRRAARPVARRRGKAKAKDAVARSILVIIWHLLASPQPGTPTSATATTRHASTPTASSATTSGRSRRSASTSPSPKPRNHIPPLTRPDPTSGPGPLPHTH